MINCRNSATKIPAYFEMVFDQEFSNQRNDCSRNYSTKYAILQASISKKEKMKDDRSSNKNFHRSTKKRNEYSYHLDAISKMRLCDIINGLCDDKWNSKFCKTSPSPIQLDKAEPVDHKKKQQSRKKLRGKLKASQCRNEFSLISLHINIPKNTKSIISSKKKSRSHRDQRKEKLKIVHVALM
ncbi:hypothetical protein HHI36_015094 [Cryptolaemus montrouzieri]|uniref:Uncharacterized protein n=1 Tax=Cryptolaemus montrouzieri TaxID=559131 RepID=A0ABD2N5U6_9CUCU